MNINEGRDTGLAWLLSSQQYSEGFLEEVSLEQGLEGRGKFI